MSTRHAAVTLVMSIATLLSLGTALGAQVTGGRMPPATTGKEVFDRWCWGCHEPLPGRFGMGNPPAGSYRLQVRYNGALPAALEQRTDLAPDLIRLVVRKGINMMPPARKTEISDAQLEALVAYLTRKE